MTSEEVRSAIREQLLDAYTSEYAFTVDTWKLLETKAQVSVTISGIFFAAIFAYAREALTLSEGALLLLTLITLLCSLANAIWSLTISRIAVPPFGTFFWPVARNVLRQPENAMTEELLLAVTGDLAKQWQTAIDAANRVNEAKSRRVLLSQILLGAAMVAATVLTITHIT